MFCSGSNISGVTFSDRYLSFSSFLSFSLLNKKLSSSTILFLAGDLDSSMKNGVTCLLISPSSDF